MFCRANGPLDTLIFANSNVLQHSALDSALISHKELLPHTHTENLVWAVIADAEAQRCHQAGTGIIYRVCVCAIEMTGQTIGGVFAWLQVLRCV